MNIRSYENGDIIEFKINYNNEIVNFTNGTINNKKRMYLREFARDVLNINGDSKEIVAVFIGKEVSDSYNKMYKYYKIVKIKSGKNNFFGTIQRKE